MKTVRHDELVALRRGAPKNTKLTVSRPARVKKQRSAKLFEADATTTINRRVMYATVNTEFATKASRQYLAQRITKFYDQYGRVPSVELIRSYLEP